jgi:DNA polymerase III delta prime subunit
MQTHHALLLHADSLEVSTIQDEYKKQSADVLHFVRDRFSIDDARELSVFAAQTPFEAEVRVFVIAVKDIAIEAQNALLKLLEEPPSTARFYIVVPKTTLLLPTLLSRLSVQTDIVESADTVNTHFESFLKSSYADRLLSIAEHTKEKDLPWIDAVLGGAESYASQMKDKDVQLYTAILFARKYIKTKGASAKMLLEELALCLPLAKAL